MLPHSVVLLRTQGPLKLYWGKNREKVSLFKHFLCHQSFADSGTDERQEALQFKLKEKKFRNY